MTNSLQEIYRQIRSFDRRSDMGTIMAGAELLAPLHEKEPYKNVKVDRDIAYGTHQRHVLDIYQPVAEGKLPVLLFLHGGSFVGGDKHRPNAPYNDNIGLWAARNKMIGVVMNYRLAPDNPYPAGAEDVNAALGWMQNNIADFGGNPNQIIALGTSAGANHVATCIAQTRLQNSRLLKAAILMSCIFEIAHAEKNETLIAYFSNDESTYAEKSNLQGLLTEVEITDLPLLITLAEYEAEQFEKQCLLFMNAYFEKFGHWPDFYRILKHNHFTSSQHINTCDTVFTDQLLYFIDKYLRS